MVHKVPTAPLIVAALLALAGGAARAEFFVCTTANGRTVTSDRQPTECVGLIKRFRDDGTPNGVIKPPPTPEERRKMDEEEKRRLDEQDKEMAQKRSDKSLLETYASLDEIEAARKRALADQQVILDRVNQRKDEIKRERKKLDDEAEFYLKRDMPEKLKRDFAANNESLKTQDKMIAETKGAISRVNDRFDIYHKRFRELLERGATPVQRTVQEKVTTK